MREVELSLPVVPYLLSSDIDPQSLESSRGTHGRQILAVLSKTPVLCHVHVQSYFWLLVCSLPVMVLTL